MLGSVCKRDFVVCFFFHLISLAQTHETKKEEKERRHELKESHSNGKHSDALPLSLSGTLENIYIHIH